MLSHAKVEPLKVIVRPGMSINACASLKVSMHSDSLFGAGALWHGGGGRLSRGGAARSNGIR